MSVISDSIDISANYMLDACIEIIKLCDTKEEAIEKLEKWLIERSKK